MAKLLSYFNCLKSINQQRFALILSVSFFLLSDHFINAQKKDQISINKELIKDTIDGKIDLSNYIINAHGVIVLPYIITEPAIGGFGVALAPLLITPKKRPEGYKGYIPPDITAGYGMYTVNNSWAAGALRVGNIPKYGLKYRVGFTYAKLNLSFYRDIEGFGNQELDFNIRATPITLEISKKIGKTELYFGTNYSFSKNVLKPNFSEDLSEFYSEKELNSNIGSLGIFLDYDKRNTIFTPDHGYRTNLLYAVNDNWTGSDYKFQDLNGYLQYFLPIKSNWIGGFRLDYKQNFGDTPFYKLPYIDLRGIPAERFQGSTVLVAETEQRFDISYRWSIIGFTGIGETINDGQNLKTGKFAFTYGTGFRYFLARTFGLRTGIDIAKGPDSWGYYLVFGHSWNR